MSVNTMAIEAVANTGAIPQPPSQTDTVAALTKYLPTESITLYIATVSAQKALSQFLPWLTAEVAYITFVVLTPVLMLLLFLRKLAIANQQWRLGPRHWPWWRMIASTIAFAVWATAIPGNPVVNTDSETQGVVAAFFSLFVSTALNIVEPLFEKKQS